MSKESVYRVAFLTDARRVIIATFKSGLSLSELRERFIDMLQQQKEFIFLEIENEALMLRPDRIISVNITRLSETELHTERTKILAFLDPMSIAKHEAMLQQEAAQKEVKKERKKRKKKKEESEQVEEKGVEQETKQEATENNKKKKGRRKKKKSNSGTTVREADVQTITDLLNDM